MCFQTQGNGQLLLLRKRSKQIGICLSKDTPHRGDTHWPLRTCAEDWD